MQEKKITFLQVLLSPITLIYRTIIVFRNYCFDWGIINSEEFKLPVISVGNITVGGTGKTPHIEYLINLLKDEFRLATLSRGYKRKTNNFMIADQSSTAIEIGDEPRQLKQKFPNITVAVDKKRVNGINQLLKLPNLVEIVLLDDAFQHRHVKPGKSILLIDYNRLITKDYIMPSGRLREPATSRIRADIILITKSPERIKPIEMRNIVSEMNLQLHQHLFFSTIKYDQFKAVFSSENTRTVEDFKIKKAPLILLTGIANPRPLRKYARSISTEIHEITYPDHHVYSKKDIKNIENKYLALENPDALILTTEKDAMRIQGLEIGETLRAALYYVSIQVEFLNDDQEEFNNLILNYVRSNKRNNILHKD